MDLKLFFEAIVEHTAALKAHTAQLLAGGGAPAPAAEPAKPRGRPPKTDATPTASTPADKPADKPADTSPAASTPAASGDAITYDALRERLIEARKDTKIGLENVVNILARVGVKTVPELADKPAAIKDAAALLEKVKARAAVGLTGDLTHEPPETQPGSEQAAAAADPDGGLF